MLYLKKIQKYLIVIFNCMKLKIDIFYYLFHIFFNYKLFLYNIHTYLITIKTVEIC